MVVRQTGKNRQGELIPRSMSPVIGIDPNHRLVKLTEQLNWDELVDLVQGIRAGKLKSAAGRPPHLRPLVGVLVLRATRRMTYRDTEDQVRYYAPARYLCALTETDWTPDTNTICDFEKLLGEDGVKLVNEYIVRQAVELGLADPTVAVADTTAQEAAIPYPNEMGLLSSFLSRVASAASAAGGVLKGFVEKAQETFSTAKKKFREYRLFAKEKSKAAKDEMTAKMVELVEHLQSQLGSALESARQTAGRLGSRGRQNLKKLKRLHEVVGKLTPQIRYWLKTGFVAAGKIVSLQIPEVYTIVRGKVGKKVEFGLQWGVTRLGGGFLLATMGLRRGDVHDQRYVVGAVRELVALLGKAPTKYAYDRGGDSPKGLEKLGALGVEHIGVAPQGRRPWSVSGKMKDELVAERAKVEGGIGAVKSGRYGFNRPAAHSAEKMGVCGQRAVLGFNLNKLVRELAKREEKVLVG